ncbi:hypothetical protein Tco_0182740, partial [Tanacetum coccineum]
GNVQGWVYAVGNAEKRGNASGNQNSNVVTENSYDVELADGKIVGRGRHYYAGLHFKLLKPSVQHRSNSHRTGLKSTWQKGCQISAKKEEDMSEGKQIKDVPIARDFPEVFPENFPQLDQWNSRST